MPHVLTRRRFIGSAAATGAAVLVAPALRAQAADSPTIESLPTAVQTYLEAQRRLALSAGGDPTFLTGTQLAVMLQARDISSAEMVDAFLARIDALNGDGGFEVGSRPISGTTPNTAIPVYGNNGKINAFVRVTHELARSMAIDADKRLDAAAKGGTPAPLGCGVPIALKDIYAIEDVELTLGCPLMKGNIATGDSSVAARARAAGLPILGQTHTGPWTSDDTCPQTANPWKRTLCVGGSSGGSAAAVASRFTPFAVGSDTSNSLRNPTCNTGGNALKPTYGLVPLFGVTPLTVSHDHGGPICRSVSDLSLLLGIIAGPDPLDPRSLQAPPRPDAYPMVPRPGDKPLAGVRLGTTVDAESSGGSVTPGIRTRLLAAVEQFRSLGAEIVTVTPPTSQLNNVAYFASTNPDPFSASGAKVGASTIWGNAENAFVLKDTYSTTAGDDPRLYGAVITRFRRNSPVNGVSAPQQLIQRAAAYTTEDLLGSYRVRREHCDKWAQIFADANISAMLWPEKLQTPPVRADDFTGSFSGTESSRTNTTGWPTVNVPVGRNADTGIPVGMNILAPLGADHVALQIALDYQNHFPYHLDVPTELQA
jgi:aspartyl-tRNA(Asn)/glutamyl-tRNA(Gln) amidotransferase subunit A